MSDSTRESKNSASRPSARAPINNIHYSSCPDRPHFGLCTFMDVGIVHESHSVTITVPVISSWPSPQNTSHEKVNLPVLSGVNRILLTFPGDTLARTPKARRLNPCSRSAEEISSTTGSPFFKVIESGLKSNFFAVM